MTTTSQIECTALTLHNPLELLFAQDRADKSGIERIAEFVADAKQMDYFFKAAVVEQRSVSAP